jgi:hypothetical protein
MAAEITAAVDQLLGKKWNRQSGDFLEKQEITANNKPEGAEATLCSCGSGIPVQKVQVDDQEISLVALPLIFEQFLQAQKLPSQAVSAELLEMVLIYNPLPDNMKAKYQSVLLHEYEIYCQKEVLQ